MKALPSIPFAASEDGRLAQARLEEDCGRYDAAQSIYDELLAAQPDKPLLLARKGLAYFLASDFRRAIALFDRALSLQPRAPVTLAYRARAKEQLGDLDGALADYRVSLRQRGRRPDIYVSIGLIHEYRHRLAAARAYYRRALSLDPDHHQAKVFLAAISAPARTAGPA